MGGGPQGLINAWNLGRVGVMLLYLNILHSYMTRQNFVVLNYVLQVAEYTLDNAVLMGCH